MRSHLNDSRAERIQWWCWRRIATGGVGGTAGGGVGGELPGTWLDICREVRVETKGKHGGRETIGEHGGREWAGKQCRREWAVKHGGSE
jgi:hypothetical protein